MESSYEIKSMKQMGSICNERQNLNVKIALLTFHNMRFSSFISKILLIVEYAQVASQILLLNLDLSPNNNDINNGSISLKLIIFFAKLFNPGYLLLLQEDTTLYKATFIALLIYIFLKYMLVAYIFLTTYYNKSQQKLLVITWQWLFRIQGRVLYSIVTSCWIFVIIEVLGNNSLMSEALNVCILVLSCIFIMIECIFSLYLYIQFCYVLPTKNFLSSKDSRIDVVTLIHKILLQALQIILFRISPFVMWVLTAINLIFNIVKSSYFYFTLPLYSIKALKYKGRILMVVTALNISCFFNRLTQPLTLKSSNLTFIITSWVILAILAIKISDSYLDRTLWNIVTNPKLNSSMLLVHRIRIIKQIRKICKVPTKKSSQCDLSYLMNITIDNNLLAIFGSNQKISPEEQIDITDKSSIKKLYLFYLKNLLARFPSDKLIKLYLAHFLAKKINLYSNAIRIITQLQQQNKWTDTYLTPYLIAFDIESTIKRVYQNRKNRIDMHRYVKCQTKVAHLKLKMLNQADFQTKIYKEMISDSPDLDKIYLDAQSADSARFETLKKIKSTLEMIPKYFTQPLLMISRYYLFLNHSTKDAIHYQKLYEMNYKKYEKHFQAEDLVENNLYQPDSAFLIVSGQKPNAGAITFCNKAAEGLFGGEANSYFGQSIATLSAPYLYNSSIAVYKNLMDDKEIGLALLDSPMRSFCYNKEGFLRVIDLYMTVLPSTNKGYYFLSMVRAVQTEKEYMLLKENGEIDLASERIARKLGLMIPYSSSSPSRKRFHVQMISTELNKVNDAFNLIAMSKRYNNGSKISSEKLLQRKPTVFDKLLEETDGEEEQEGQGKIFSQGEFDAKLNERKRKINIEDAEKLYSIFTCEGQEINLTSLLSNRNTDGHETYKFRCKVENQQRGAVLLKVVTLQEIQKPEQRTMEGNQKVNETSLTATKKEKNFSKIRIDIDNEVVKHTSKINNLGSYRREIEAPENQLALITPTSDEYPLHLISSSSIPDEVSTLRRNKIPYPSADSRSNLLVSSPRLQSKQKVLTETSRCLFHKEKALLDSGFARRKAVKKRTNIMDDLDKHYKQASSPATSDDSKSSSKIRISEAFKAALAVKYYPKHLRGLQVILSTTLLIVIMSQARLKFLWDEDSSKIMLRKDLMVNIQSISFLLPYSERFLSLSYDLYVGRITENDLKDTGIILANISAILLDSFKGLNNMNHQILTGMDSMDEQTQRVYLRQNVIFWDTYYDKSQQENFNMTISEGINKLIETGLDILPLGLQSFTGRVQSEMALLLRNSVGGLLVESTTLLNQLLLSLNSQKESIQSFSVIYLALNVVMFMLAIAATALVIYKFYEEKRNLMANFSKLNMNAVAQILERVTNFKLMLIEERSFGAIDYDNCVEKVKGTRTSRFRHIEVKNHLRTPNYAGIQRRYSLLFARSAILGFIITGITILFFMLTKNSAQVLTLKLTQLYTAGAIRTRLSVMAAVYELILSSNPMVQVENNAPYVNHLIALGELAYVQKNLFSDFLRNGDETSQEIRNVLLNSNCNSPDAEYVKFCNALRANGMDPSFIRLLPQLENTIKNGFDSYVSSDRTFAAAKTIQLSDYQIRYSLFYVITYQADLLFETSNHIVETHNKDADMQRKLNLVIFMCPLAVIALCNWFFSLQRLTEKHDKIKKVLQTLPADLVLDNFMLKSFISKNSRGALDSVRSEI